MLSEVCRKRESGCSKSYCVIVRTAYIYGFIDFRLGDIFYVGSTIYLGDRFTEHLRGARDPYNCKSLWLQNILEDGSYPVPIILHTFLTNCELYTRQVEREVAEQVRSEGHTAYQDAYMHPMYVDTHMQALCPIEKYDWRVRRPIEMDLWAEHIDRIAEQARVTRMLQEMYLYG